MMRSAAQSATMISSMWLKGVMLKILENSNVSIIKDGAVQEWLCNAAIMIHNGCTTAIEAYFAGLEPICYSSYIDDEYIQYLTFEVSEVVNDSFDLLKLIQQKINGNRTMTEAEC